MEWFERFLECAAERIRFSALPIGELLKQLSAMEEFVDFSLLQTSSEQTDFRMAWQQGLDDFSDEFTLSKREKELFSDFMSGFGRTDVVGEIHYCEQYRTLVHNCLNDVRSQAKEKERLYLTLGFCVSGLTGLLFL